MTDPQTLAQLLHDIVEMPTDPQVRELRRLLGIPLSKAEAQRGREIFDAKLKDYDKAVKAANQRRAQAESKCENPSCSSRERNTPSGYCNEYCWRDHLQQMLDKERRAQDEADHS